MFGTICPHNGLAASDTARDHGRMSPRRVVPGGLGTRDLLDDERLPELVDNLRAAARSVR
jgi:hypothetical protein